MKRRLGKGMPELYSARDGNRGKVAAHAGIAGLTVTYIWM